MDLMVAANVALVLAWTCILVGAGICFVEIVLGVKEFFQDTNTEETTNNEQDY